MTPNSDGLLFVPMQARGKFPLIWTPNKEYIGDTVRIAAETDDLHALIAYVQKLGMNRGKWRDLFEPQEIEVTDITIPRSAEWIAYGKEVYERRCIGCHGDKGDGNGPAATFLFNQRPRNFSAGVFKFRLSQKPVPTDGDLLRTITRGVRGTAMPAWYELPLNDRLAVIQYIKYVLAVDRSEPTSLMRISPRNRQASRYILESRLRPRRRSWRMARTFGKMPNAGSAMARPARATAKRLRG